MNTPTTPKSNLINFVSWFLIGTGVILRLIQYFSNKSLWRDEIYLVLNIIEKPISAFFYPLDYNQHAPPGFLIVEKIIIKLLGTNEFAFRLFPLICGIGSLFLFYKLSKKCISKEAVPVALGLFAVFVPLLYYSSETKQYSSDVLFSLILVLMSLKISEENLSISKAIYYGLFGTTIIWFSHTSIFILVGTGFFFMVDAVVKKDLRKTLYVLIFYLLWIISFAIFFFKILIHTSSSIKLSDYWGQFYLPAFSFSHLALNTYKLLYREFFRFSTLGTFSSICLIIGLITFWRNNKKMFFIIVAPILVTLLASAFHKYPLFERFILFLIPLIILLIAEGTEWIKQKASKISPILGIMVICLLFYKPLYFTKENFTNPITQEEVKPVLKYLKEHLKVNDVIYIAGPFQCTFKYYSKEYNLCNNFSIKLERKKLEEVQCSSFNYSIFIGPRKINKTSFAQELGQLKGHKRVWLLFPEKLSLDIEYKSLTLSYLDKIGVRTGSFIRPGVILYLYDLSTGST